MEQNTDLNISPTPWAVERVTYDPGMTSVVRAANGTVVHWRKPGRDDSEYMRDQQNAEAQLIAAAPDLLEALQALRTANGANDFNGWHSDFDEAIAKARAAIAKATGSDH